MAALRQTIARLVDETPFVDTHEHLWEEATRLAPGTPHTPGVSVSDFSVLFFNYDEADLTNAGYTPQDRACLLDSEAAPRDKWRALAPSYERAKHTGYLQCARETVRVLCGEGDIREDNCEAIGERLRAYEKPGFYRHILRDICNIDHAHVNSLETPVFMATGTPGLLRQDIGLLNLSNELDIPAVSQWANREVASLDDWHGVIDWVFDTYGPRAVAVKNQGAYWRALDYEQVSAEDAAPLFARYLQDPGQVAAADFKAIQDHLFHYCVRKATEYELPVKLHTGYFNGCGIMPLHRLRHNAGDLCPIFQAHPDARFVVMHINYPRQHEAIALAKHYPNVYADMCWAWILNTSASVRFVKEFLTAVPANKLFPFGGDFVAVEAVAGHARMARKGLSQAFAELVEEGWFTETELARLIPRLMHGNAHALYGRPESQAE